MLLRSCECISWGQTLFIWTFLRKTGQMFSWKMLDKGLLPDASKCYFWLSLAFGMKPSDITFWPCLTTYASTWLISYHISPWHTMSKWDSIELLIVNKVKQYQQTTGFIQRLINITLHLLTIAIVFIEFFFKIVLLFVFFFQVSVSWDKLPCQTAKKNKLNNRCF